MKPHPKPNKRGISISEWKEMAASKRGNKYKAIKQTYNGFNYDSRREARHAAELDWRIKEGSVMRWERQHKITISLNGRKICDYYIDFKVYMADGSIEYHEVKGAETAVWRLKWKLARAMFPDWKMKIIR